VGSSAARRADENFDYSPSSLSKSFQGWLHEVTVSELANESAGEQAAPEIALQVVVPKAQAEEVRNVVPLRALPSQKRPALKDFSNLLNTQEFIQVSLVTVRESFTHRYWPESIVLKFLEAEIIRSRAEGQDQEEDNYDDSINDL
jgi:hypothetical protein